ncbi:MAG TPA: helix-turn-helix domain-containing protein [Candidatus Saccharimonadales bacterium]|nr:helix-turn-helix domain-containing protein [Candidatus Saccharimonadales bacterium]
MDDVYEALADSTRRLMLDELAERKEQTFYELYARLVMKHQIKVSRQAINKHLSVLEKATLTTSVRRGKYKLICFNDAPLRRLGERWVKG